MLVVFTVEGMVPELKDLESKGIFNHQEIKAIVAKRTAFETSLVRRVAQKLDFLNYIKYEINLESLRKKRVQRLSKYCVSYRSANQCS